MILVPQPPPATRLPVVVETRSTTLRTCMNRHESALLDRLLIRDEMGNVGFSVCIVASVVRVSEGARVAFNT